MTVGTDLEISMAHRAHANTFEVNGSLTVYIGHPGAVAGLIKRAARRSTTSDPSIAERTVN